ncbi:hypothetical protein PCASD_26187 [Puccinia coronata f. sp. avenae]|uniref:Uncharacterized protein n=1 Tax=Puccinia coronata f. sp. avenae TaxID=200324 RepID=A0A2N5TNH4_9BASI|nr:hypothetical protein PCASD_26187 [Puccinia coronata f. sp. avenae]
MAKKGDSVTMNVAPEAALLPCVIVPALDSHLGIGLLSATPPVRPGGGASQGHACGRTQGDNHQLRPLGPPDYGDRRSCDTQPNAI